ALKPLRREESPLDPVPRLPSPRWVEPRVVIRAEFAEWTTDGLLRQAAFKGIEVGKEPSAVVREEALPLARVAARAPGTARSRRGETVSAKLVAATEAELSALDAMEREGMWQIAGHELRVTNLGKVLFPADDDHPALTKRDLIRHYVTVGPVLVPHLAGRGLNL